MDYQSVISSPMLWLVSSFLVIISVSQAVVFLRAALKEANTIGIDGAKRKAAIRASCITAIGPSLSPIIMLLSLVAVIGAPTTWMRLCDVGAARTELGVVSLVASFVGVEVGSADFGLQAFSYSLWGMALNNFGWLFVVFILTHKMEGIVDGLYAKYNPAWIKLLMAGATVGLFSYLLSNQLYTFSITKWVPALISAACMFFCTVALKKNQRMQEVALGLSMLIGMFASQAIFG